MTPEIENASMKQRKRNRRNRLWFNLAELVIALFVPLTIVVYTVIQNNTEIVIAQQNREQDLKIAAERHEQDMILSDEAHEEATLVHYFDSLSKLLEKNEKLVDQIHIARFQTLTALAQLKSKRKGFLIRSLIENKLIIMSNGQNSILDLSLADLTGLDLSNHMLVNNEMRCAILSQTTLTNATFRNMALHGSTFIQTVSANSDFSSSYTYAFRCGNINQFGVKFDGAVLDDSTFDDANYVISSFSKSSLNRARMRHFKCEGCQFRKATMNSVDLSGAQFSLYLKRTCGFQLANMSSALLYKAKFIRTDFGLATLTMINATETIFDTSNFVWASLENSSFVQTIIINSSFESASLKGSSWDKAKVNYTSFLKADMTYVSFTNSECHYCLFNQTQLIGTNFTNSSLDGSDFRQSEITYEQLVVARSLRDVILPNRTIIQ